MTRKRAKSAKTSKRRKTPGPLDLPEGELLLQLQAAIQAGVFSDDFLRELRTVLARATAPAGAAAPAGELERVQAHFHQLIRSRAGDRLEAPDSNLPRLSRDQGSEDEPAWFPVEGMDGGFKYWWDAAAPGLRLMSESWSRLAAGSGQLHEITPGGARLLGEGFV
jgi:hypothetical protein